MITWNTSWGAGDEVNAIAPSGELCAASRTAAWVVRNNEWNAETDCVAEGRPRIRVSFLPVFSALIATLVRPQHDA